MGDAAGYATAFATGHTVFTFGHIMHAPTYYRGSDISYGILPQPKYDTEQERYIAFACPSLFSVPITCQNTELAGFVFEAMTYYGYFDVIPVYYGTTLKGKVADAPEDVEVLEIVNDALTVSFAYCYDNWEGFAHFLSGTVMNFTDTGGNKDVASVYAKRNKIAQKRLDRYDQPDRFHRDIQHPEHHSQADERGSRNAGRSQGQQGNRDGKGKHHRTRHFHAVRAGQQQADHREENTCAVHIDCRAERDRKIADLRRDSHPFGTDPQVGRQGSRA